MKYVNQYENGEFQSTIGSCNPAKFDLQKARVFTNKSCANNSQSYGKTTPIPIRLLTQESYDGLVEALADMIKLNYEHASDVADRGDRSERLKSATCIWAQAKGDSKPEDGK